MILSVSYNCVNVTSNIELLLISHFNGCLRNFLQCSFIIGLVACQSNYADLKPRVLMLHSMQKRFFLSILCPVTRWEFTLYDVSDFLS